MSHLLDGLLSVPPPIAYLLIGVLVFGEAAVFLGFVLPGETAVVLGGVLAARGQISIVALCVLVVVCAVAGDSVGFEVGRHFGDRVLRLRPLRQHEQRLDRARSFLRHRGAFAVFLGRWTAFLRAVIPGLAGLSRMHYPRFLFFNAVGGVAWGITYCLIGYLAGASYAQIEKQVGAVGAVATVVVVLIGLLVWHRHRRRGGSGEPDERPAPCANVGEQG